MWRWRRGTEQSTHRVPIRAATPRATPAASRTFFRPPRSLSTSISSTRMPPVLHLFLQQACWRLQELHPEEAQEKQAEAGHVQCFSGSANAPCLPNQYTVKKIKDIWGVRCRLPLASRTVALSALARGRQTNLGKISRIARWRLYSYEGAPGPMESNTDFFESKRTTSKHTPYLLLEHPPYRSDSAHLGSLQTHYPFRTWLLLRRH